MELSRRQFMKGASVGIAGTTLGALGFGDIEEALATSIRPWKLANLTETRNTCTYCSVACGIIMYSKGDLKKGERAEIVHIEGDPDHPTNRGTLCPKGAGLLDMTKYAGLAAMGAFAVIGLLHHVVTGANRVSPEDEENARRLAGGRR